MAKKTFSMKMRTNKDRKITLFGMISIAILAVFNFNNVIDNYVGLGMSASFAFAIAVIIFLFPFIFIIAEFASLAKSSKSGLTSWIETAVGRKTAFLTSFMFWFANLTYFLSAVPQRLNFISFAVTGGDYTGDRTYLQIVPWVGIAFFLLITFISTLNTKKLSFITTIGGAVMMGITVAFFVMAIIGWIAGAANGDLLYNGVSEAPGIGDINLWGDAAVEGNPDKAEGFAWISTFIWVLMAADGAQTLGVYVNDVKGGKKTFIRAMLISVCLIGFAYIIGTVLVSVFPPAGGLGNGWANSFSYLFYFMFQNVMTFAQVQKFTFILMGWLFFISSIGGLLIWTSAPVKVMFSEIPGGVFGEKLARENRNGVCSWGAWLQYIIVVCLLLPLMLVPVYAQGGEDSDISKILRLIKGAAGWIGLLPWVVIFVAYVNLRLKKDNEERSFKMGPRWFGIAVGIFLSVVTIGIMGLAFLDTAPLNKPYDVGSVDPETGKPNAAWDSTWYLGPVLKVVMIVCILIPAYLWYYFKYEYQIRDCKVAERLGMSNKCVLDKYTFTKKNKFQFLYTDEYANLTKKENDILLKAKKEMDAKNEQIAKLSEQADNESDKTKAKELKVQIKEIEKEIKAIILASNNEIQASKLAFKNTLNERYLKDKESFLKDMEKIDAEILRIREQDAQNKSEFTTLKAEIIALKKNLDTLEGSEKEKALKEFDAKFKQYEALEEKARGYKILMNENIHETIEKDIDLNEKSYNDLLEKDEKILYNSKIIFDYGKLAAKKLSDEVVITNKRFFLIRNQADDIIGKTYKIENMKFYEKPITESVDMICDGKWETFTKFSFVYDDNTQLETFSVYAPAKNAIEGKFFK